MNRHEPKTGAVSKARSLRRSATPEERIIWQNLRRHMAAAKFRRQVPMGPYFVDFLSHSAKLVIELDGSHHAFQSPYDEQRTRFLESEGYRVIRFWNRDVIENLHGVFAAIKSALKKSPSPLVGEGAAKRRMRGNPSPHPSPTRGEGDSVNLSVGV
jgi:very-short-patch-repair endonuclease